MKSLSFFIAGLASTLSFGMPSASKYPFPFPHKAIGGDWENIGGDLRQALKQLNELDRQNEAPQELQQ